MAFKLKLDSPGIRSVLLSPEVASAVHDAAARVAAAYGSQALSDGQLMEAEVRDHTRDRAVSVVVVTHSASLNAEAKHGYLAAAAGASGS